MLLSGSNVSLPVFTRTVKKTFSLDTLLLIPTLEFRFLNLYYGSAKSLIFVKRPKNKLDGFVRRRNFIECVIPAKARIQDSRYKTGSSL